MAGWDREWVSVVEVANESLRALALALGEVVFGGACPLPLFPRSPVAYHGHHGFATSSRCHLLLTSEARAGRSKCPLGVPGRS
jgi:hypothetical protein